MTRDGNEPPFDSSLVSFYPGEDPRAPAEEIEGEWDGFMDREELTGAEPQLMDYGDVIIAAIEHRRDKS